MLPFPLPPLPPLVVLLAGCDVAAAAPVVATVVVTIVATAVAAAAAAVVAAAGAAALSAAVRMCVLPLIGPLGTDGVMGKGGGIVQVSGGGVGAMHSQTRSRGGGWGAKTLKPSHCGLVPGLPCQTARVGGGGWWWCVSLEEVAVVGVAFANAS